MRLVKINFCDTEFIGWVAEIVFGQIKVTVRNLIHQMDKDIIKVDFNSCARFGPCPWNSLNLWISVRLIACFVSIDSRIDCLPLYSYARKFLGDKKVDYIESYDFFESTWFKTGIKEDQFHYWHFFNERKQEWKFYTTLNL